MAVNNVDACAQFVFMYTKEIKLHFENLHSVKSCCLAAVFIKDFSNIQKTVKLNVSGKYFQLANMNTEYGQICERNIA